MRALLTALGLMAVGVTGCSAVDPQRSDDDGSDDIGFSDDDPGFPTIDAGIAPGRPVDGGFRSTPARLSAVITAKRRPPPLSGGTLTVAPDGAIVVAADSDRDVVYLVRPKEQTSKQVVLPTGSEPGRAVLDGAGHAHVALRGTGKVVSIDLAEATISASTDVCTLPRGIAYDAKRDALVVACASGELVTLAAATHAKLSSVDVKLDLRDVVVGKAGLSVSRYRSAELLHLDADGKVTATSSPTAIKQQRFDPVTGNAATVTFSPSLAWKTLGLSSGGSMMLHQESQDDEVVIGPQGGYGGGCETITQASLTSYDDDGKPTQAITVAPHGLAVDLAVSRDGQFFALAEPGSYLGGGNTVELFSVANLKMLEASSFPLGDAGIVSPGCASGIPVGADMQATSVAFDDLGTLYVFSREPAQVVGYLPVGDVLFTGALSETFRVTLSTDTVRDTGHELFHADVGSGLSCAGCHGEALDDGHVWNFKDFGPRRTQTMRGGLLSTLPLHWEGDLPTFKHLVDEVMTRRMGGFTVEGKYADALAGWLDQLPALQLGSAEKAADDAVARGKALFESEAVGCASCHSGTHFTNNTTVDVGTGGKFQVPTLLGISLHPPFLHDGCAATMAERFEPGCGGGDKHGKTSQLGSSELGDLISYLNTL